MVFGDSHNKDVGIKNEKKLPRSLFGHSTI